MTATAAPTTAPAKPTPAMATPPAPAPSPAQKAERERYVALAFCWADLLFELDRNGALTFASGATEAFLGRKPKDLSGTPLADLFAPEDGPLVNHFLKTVHNRGRHDNEILRLRRPHGPNLPVTVAGYHLDGKFFVAMRMRAASLASVTDHVVRDQKTGLVNHEAFSEAASQRIKQMQELGQKAEVSVVALAGLADLKTRLGANAADQLMSSVGAALKASSLDGDTATQIDDDKFSLVHQATVDLASIEEQIALLAKRADPTGQGVSVEAASLDMAGADAINQEDLAKGLMYALSSFQKEAGAEFRLDKLSANIGTLVSKGVSEVNGFKRMVAEGKFYVALQPIIDIKTGDIHHYEALCRFEQGAPGESPYRYITFAEETGLIHDFDLAMAKKVIEWLSKMPRNNDKYRVAVNISGFSIGMPGYVEGLHKLLKANDWTKGKLMFEITESSRMSDLESANAFIQGLRKRGHHVCLDDFGAGAASFQYLSALEVDVVKIDGSAVKNAQKAPKGRAFLSALTELCNRLGVETIAEMVDSSESLAFVRDCRCDYVQGFLFGKPSSNLADFTPLPHGNLFKKR